MVLNDEPFLLPDRPYKPDPAWFEKINKEMQELAEKIPVVAKQPSSEEVWCEIGDLQYGHPITPLILRYRALMWFIENPPDPRGEKFASRPGPYTVYVNRADMAEVIKKSVSTLDRMLVLIRENYEIKPYKSITVELFCRANNLPEDQIQQQLHELCLQKLKHKKGRKDPDD